MEKYKVIKKRIKKINVVENEDTYDINCPKNHNFFANDILVHNSEIILRSNQFCNLSEVIIRENDDLDTLKIKVRNATILGVVQSTLTNFKFLNRNWKKNCEEERLLGVSLTGLADNNVLNRKSTKAKEWLFAMKQEALSTMKEWCHALEINMSTSFTAVKPSGNVSQLMNTSSGIHPRYSPYYIRRVRVDSMDPMCQFMINKGVPYQPEVGKKLEDCKTYVFEFPCKSPDSAVMRDEKTALEQLEYWKMIQDYWCTHKPSCTIYVKENEWLEVLAWLYKNWDFISGVSFLPYDGGIYKLAPYEEITEEKYNELINKMPEIDYNELDKFEEEDNTTGAQEYACIGEKCELV